MATIEPMLAAADVHADRPWLNEYGDVPSTLAPYPDRTLVDVVHATAMERPEHPALLFRGARLSYAELDRATDALGRAIAERGISPGDRIALLLPNSPQAVIAQLGAWKAGAIVAPLNPLYTEYELKRALDECGAETIVVLTPFYRKVKRIQSSTTLRTIIATNIKEGLRPLQRVLFSTFKEEKGGHRIDLQPGDVWLPALLADDGNTVDGPAPPRPDDPALLLFTGGTTGQPKAALGSHHALLISAMQTHAWFRPILREWDDIVVLAMPLSHIYGNIGILATSLIGHHPLALVPNPRDLGDVVRTIERTHAAFFPAVPALINALLDHPRVNSRKADFSSVKLCISGSAPLMAESRRRFESLTGGRIVDAYSITEAMNAAIINPVARGPRPGAIGVPLPDVELRVTALEGDGDVPIGEDGELLLRAPQLMTGYWGRPGETDDMIVDGWLHTGDIGHLDEDGYVHVVDRRKDMIKPGGYAVWPREVEEVIAAHPEVVEAGVAGVPDPHHGEAVKAWVVALPGSALTADQIQAWCRERLAPYKVPRIVEFRDALPRSYVGKVLRRDLVEERDEGPQVRSVTVNGARLSVEERGSGPETVLFLHGVLLNRRIFDRQLDALKDRYRCVAFDFRGHGRSEVTDDGYSVDALTDDAVALIDAAPDRTVPRRGPFARRVRRPAARRAASGARALASS